MPLTQQQLRVMCKRSVVSSLSSSKTMCHLNECTHPPCHYHCLSFQTSETGDIHVHFITSLAPTPRSEPSELQNLRQNSTAGLPQKKNHNVNGPTLWHGFQQRIIDNATDE